MVSVTLNGEPCSEGRMDAAYAGLRGIPVGLVSGDDAVCEESRGLYTGVQTAQVKTAIDRYSARCLTPETAHRRIRDAARTAVEGAEKLRAYVPEPPTPSPWSSTTLARRPASSTFRGSSGQTTG